MPRVKCQFRESPVNTIVAGSCGITDHSAAVYVPEDETFYTGKSDESWSRET